MIVYVLKIASDFSSHTFRITKQFIVFASVNSGRISTVRQEEKHKLNIDSSGVPGDYNQISPLPSDIFSVVWINKILIEATIDITLNSRSWEIQCFSVKCTVLNRELRISRTSYLSTKSASCRLILPLFCRKATFSIRVQLDYQQFLLLTKHQRYRPQLE